LIRLRQQASSYRYGTKAGIIHGPTRAVVMTRSFDGSPPRRIGGGLAPVTNIDAGGKPTSARSVRSYLARAFGDRLKEIHVEMEALHFRPGVAKGAEGWGCQGVLHFDRIRAAVGLHGV
jgi:hypothetical protein